MAYPFQYYILRAWLFCIYVILFIYLFGCAGSSLLKGFSLAAVGRGCSGVAVHRLLIMVASLVMEHWLNSGGARD